MAEIIITALAGLAVSVALWGMARHQIYLYRVEKRIRALRNIRRDR